MIDVNKAVINVSGFPEDEIEDIRQSLATLYSIRTGEQPLARDMGIDMSFLDKPINIAKNLFVVEIIDKTKRYESRVEVDRIEFRYEQDGQMIPVIYIKKRGIL